MILKPPMRLKGKQQASHPPGGACVHPRLDENGNQVLIRRPSKPTELSAWNDPTCIASVLPDGKLPPAVNGVAFRDWDEAPSTAEAWEALALESKIDEPEFTPPMGLASASGVVIREPDGRIWWVCPTNQFAGYEITFPKGRKEGKSLQSTALVEAFEESGLRVRLLRHLVDVKRSLTYTRYYLAERIGGTPAAMGWESQCVMLVPSSLFTSLRPRTPDKTVLAAYQAMAA